MVQEKNETPFWSIIVTMVLIILIIYAMLYVFNEGISLGKTVGINIATQCLQMADTHTGIVNEAYSPTSYNNCIHNNLK